MSAQNNKVQKLKYKTIELPQLTRGIARNAQMENKNREEVKECSKNNCLLGFQDASRNYCGNRVCRIMKAVHEIKG